MRWNRLLAGRTGRWVAAAVVLVVVAAIALAAVARGGGSTSAVRTENVTVTVPGGPGATGTVSIDATLYLPPATGRLPAVLMAHGFGGSKLSIAADARDLAGHGFVVLAYSARGFGASTGQIGLDSLDYEIPDARALVSWLATRPEVQLDKAGDPRVGVTGASYGGALSLMLAGTDPRIDAVVPVITWNDLSAALFPNALDTSGPSAGTPAQATAAADGVFKKSWAANLLASVISGASLTGTGSTAQADSGDSGFGRSTRSSTATAAAAPTSPGDAGAAPGDAATTPADPPATTGVGSAATSIPGVAASGPATSAKGAPAGIPAAAGSNAVTAGCGRLMLAICAAYAQTAQTGRETAALKSLLANSSPAAVVGRITAPTLLVQGEKDTLFGLDQSDANARAIAANGATVAMTWYNGGHDGGSPDQVTRNRMTGWFTHYLAGTGAAPSTAFTYSVNGPLSETGQARTRTLQVPGYPGLSGAAPVRQVELPLTGRPQSVLNPPGGSPAGISSLPGLSGLVGTALANFAGGLPGQTARFSTAPLSALTVIAGTPRVSVRIAGVPLGSAASGTAAPGAVLFAAVSKVSAGGTRTLAGGAVAPLRIPGLPADGTPATVTIDLPAVSLQVEAGSTIEVALSTTDQAYAGPTVPAAYQIALAGADGTGTLLVPEVTGVRVSASEIPIGTLIALIVVAVVAVLGLVLMGRVRRPSTAAPQPETAVPAPAAVPLDIAGLGKSYPGGVTAVADVTFRVETGQVLGLLGPNGAGKTTTLRMVMGLITPTAGEIRVFGQLVQPGADILSRIGSFVEGSGFLPHLSGKANLDLYWRATGRPRADAHLDEALKIAALGTAINRRVKTYSQGMRQRLAIAQAMLGLPDLLLLDEPTNGLDPPQIHAMREVLRRYAATGRTVLISSHMLSEVEQTCSHVVVVNQGRTIATGTVAELVAASGDMVFTVDSESRALAVLRALPGIGEVDLDDPDRSAVGDPSGGPTRPGTVRADLGEVTAPQAVSALVGAGVAVTTAAPRNRLEDVFLDLVGATGPPTDGGPR